ncbi:MAG TPA: Na+/H+ antiporter [Terriglobales bacterium]|nr:Na+/H+ antiporter [Terriglobales bacterium]
MPAVATVLGLLVAVAFLAFVARRIHLPYPIVLVLGGLGIALIPGLPYVQLSHDIVFLVFLPPLIYSAGWFTSVRDFRANLRPIVLLAIGLVFFTVVCIAALGHTMQPSLLPWAAAFTLGAIVAPSDSVAATAIFSRLGAPRRIVTILEGESLLNDASGLIAFNFALAAVVTGSFSLVDAGRTFVISGVGGVALGLAVAWLFNQVQRRIEDPPIEITLSVLVPYAIYLAAQEIGLSAVLAVAVAGIYAGWRSPETYSATTRIQAMAVWGVFLFVLNGLVFVLIGLQLPAVLNGLDRRSVMQYLEIAAAVSLAVIALRFIWVFPATYLPRLPMWVRRRDPFPGWRNVVIVAWTGMRGVVSLAAVLSLPAMVGRGLMLFVTFSVILVTLVLQGLSLPMLMRKLGVADDGSAVEEELEARTRTIDAALERLELLADEDWTRPEGVTYMRHYYGKRRKSVDVRFGRLDHDHSPDGHHHEDGEVDGEDHVAAHRATQDGWRRLRQELIATERSTLVRLRNAGTIGDEVLHRVERDLDLEEVRLAQD